MSWQINGVRQHSYRKWPGAAKSWSPLLTAHKSQVLKKKEAKDYHLRLSLNVNLRLMDLWGTSHASLGQVWGGW